MSFNEFDNKYIFIRDSYTGLGGFNPYEAYSYLNKFLREEGEFFSARRVNTILNNIVAPLMNLYLKPISGTEVTITTQNTDLNYIIDNSNLIANANDILKDYKLYNLSYYGIYTDGYWTEEGEWMAVQEVAPEIIKIFPGDIKEVVMSGNDIDNLIYIEKKEYKNKIVPVACYYMGDSKMVFKETQAWYTSDGDITLEEGDGVRRLTVFDGTYYCSLHKAGVAKLNDTPDSFQLCRMQKELFNLESLRTEILINVAFPILTIATDQELEDIALSVNNLLKVPSTVTKMPGFLEPDLVSVDKLKETIEEKKSYIYKVFTSGLFSDNVKYTTAMSSAIASSSFLSELKDLYIVYKDLVNTLVDDIVEIYDINTTVTIEFPELDFEAVTEDATGTANNLE